MTVDAALQVERQDLLIQLNTLAQQPAPEGLDAATWLDLTDILRVIFFNVYKLPPPKPDAAAILAAYREAGERWKAVCCG